jgi:RNA polymerase sigma factor (sigma-70 family)
VDAFLTRRLGDLLVNRAIECKAGPVRVEDVDDFLIKLKLVKREFPAVLGTIVSGVSFSDAVAAHAAAEGIQLTLARDLSAQLIDGNTYTTNLIRDCEADERYQLKLYVEPIIGDDSTGAGSKGSETIHEWINDPDWNQLTLLGDVGTGKSFLARITAYRLAKKFRDDQIANPLPILIDLRHADREMSLEGLIMTHLSRSGIGDSSFAAFQYALAQGNIVLILDGFDEMASRITPQVMIRNFNELARAVTGRAKVLLTCRTHYFRSRTEEEEVVFASHRNDPESGSARQLYWDLIARRGFRIAYLRPFDVRQIDEYVRRACGPEATTVIKRIRRTYNLLELSQRPMLLDMIVKSIHALEAGTVNAATLYTVFTDAWVHRDSWREVLEPGAKFTFLTALARSLWDQEVSTVHYTALSDYVQSTLASLIANPRELVEIDTDVRTASFLTRDEHGHYGFAHKSYAEFFLARHICQELLAKRAECLNTRRFGHELIMFMGQLCSTEVDAVLEGVLTQPYRQRISENALTCLYGIRRERLLGASDDLQPLDHVPLPAGIQMAGADLDGVTLEAADLTGASFMNARLSNAILARAVLLQADLTNAALTNADLTSCDARLAQFDGATFDGANLDTCNMTGASLRATTFAAAYIGKLSVEDADLSGSILGTEKRQGLRQERIRGAIDASAITEERVLELVDIVNQSARFMAVSRDIDVEDLAERAILRLLSPSIATRIASLPKPQQAQYVYSLLRNLSIDIDRARRREVSFESLDDEVKNTFAQESEVLSSLIRDEEMQRLNAALETLSPGVRRIVQQRFFDGLSVASIAALHGLSDSGIYNRLRAGLRQLRAVLIDGNEDHAL